MCFRKKRDNPSRRPKKGSATRAPRSANRYPLSDADFVESTVFDRKRDIKIDAGNQKMKNRAIVEASNDFATRLLKEFVGSESESICISPLSVSFVVAMSLAGAKKETEAKIMEILGKDCSLHEIEVYFMDVKTIFQQLSELEILHSANRIYYDGSIDLSKPYKEKVTLLYGEDGIELSDFNDSDDTATKINAFVEETTKGNLGNVISADEVSGNRMILLNALDFRGKWKKPFQPMLNEIKEFHLLNGSTKKTEMMKLHDFLYVTASDYFYCENDEMRRICLPYKSEQSCSHVGEISMYIFLPRELNGLPKLVENLNGEKLLEWLRMEPQRNYIQKEPTTVIMHNISIMIPKFTIRTDLELSGTLQKIGLENYFSDADFSGTSNAPLQADSFIHKTFVKTDELGTEASASREGKLKGCGTGYVNIRKEVIEVEFHANRPFLYAIVSRKQHVLFIGTVMDVDEMNEAELNARKNKLR